MPKSEFQKQLPWVLVVEDSDDDWNLLLRAARPFVLRYQFIHASTGHIARQALETQTITPSLIFLDYKLPGISGPDLIELIRNYSGSCPIVITSNSERAEALVKECDPPVDGFLQKPIGYVEYLAAVSQTLGRWL